MRKLLLSAVALAAMAVAAPATAGVTIYGLTFEEQGNRLVSFDVENPMSFINDLVITDSAANIAAGRMDFGPGTSTSLFGLDLRASDQQLYAISRVSQKYALFTISLDAKATFVSEINDPSGTLTNITPENIGFDFNPTNGNLRIITPGSKSFNVDPITGVATKSMVNGDDELNFNDDPRGSVSIVGAAYSNNDTNAATGTTLYVLDDSQEDYLATLTPPSGVTLVRVGTNGLFENGFGTVNDPDLPPPGLNGNAGFDIYTENGQNFALFNIGFAGGGECQGGDAGCIKDDVSADILYRLNLATGEATRIGNLDRRLTALTAGPFINNGIPEPATWAMMIGGFGLVGATARRRRRNLAAC